MVFWYKDFLRVLGLRNSDIYVADRQSDTPENLALYPLLHCSDSRNGNEDLGTLLHRDGTFMPGTHHPNRSPEKRVNIKRPFSFPFPPSSKSFSLSSSFLSSETEFKRSKGLLLKRNICITSTKEEVESIWITGNTEEHTKCYCIINTYVSLENVIFHTELLTSHAEGTWIVAWSQFSTSYLRTT